MLSTNTIKRTKEVVHFAVRPRFFGDIAGHHRLKDLEKQKALKKLHRNT